MFYEEARELLISLEEGLMELERRQGDRAHLDKTFRAAHSVKGAAAMVGLGAIAEFTHGIEAVLERIRTGSLAVDSDIITTLLESRDHLAAMVEGEAGGSPIPGSSHLSQRLTDLLTSTRPPEPPDEPPPAAPPTHPSPSPAPVPAPSSAGPPPPSKSPEPRPEAPQPPPATGPPTKPDEPEPPAAESSPESKPAAKPKRSRRKTEKPAEAGGETKAEAKPKAPPRGKAAERRSMPSASPAAPKAAEPEGEPKPLYRIRFAPGPDVLKRGVNLLGVFDELRELGELEVLADAEAVPTLDDFDAERCYLSWTCTLRTDVEPERLDDVFLFVAEDGAIGVERRLDDGSFEPVETPLLKLPRGTPVSSPPTPVARSQPVPAPAPIETPAAPASAAAADGAKRPVVATNVPAARAHGRIRVDAQQLDDLVGLAGELAVISDNLQGLREVRSAAPWGATLESLLRVSREIRDTTLDLRMVPVDELFSRFPRFVRDQADRSGKEIELRIFGQETKLDRTIIERLGDPMIHLIRNAVDHALELPEERLAAGKPRVGRITLTAGHEGDRVALKVEDDGRGLDRERIVRKGIDRGLIPPGTSPDDPRVVGLIFEAGFSTRDQVSDMSGRGVGLDVVRDSVRALRGSLGVESTPGKGTSFTFRLPLTLALIDGLLIETGGGRYVVPLAQVEECVALGGVQTALSEDRSCVTVRGELVPTISLRRLFGIEGPPPVRQELLLTRYAGRRVGVAVDRLSGRVQAVIQSLGEGLHGLGRFSGATILGDGSVSLILDLAALVSESRIAENTLRSTPMAGVRAETVR
ncbi:chemotaxis protein CheA [Planctomyces sp. SH-PL62]|uniref:chemotaxis protein CheA n=1 Tax=Planctomyces sp. SH-PL62 TaxID=1636152 RepID=UPI00078E718B|nr:chemotaxis protein CheA [Planctomyces sp. SH-PL62]AMV36443.1 Chemotaxis protein CheA [Planctomyces sp. SH-PL62]